MKLKITDGTVKTIEKRLTKVIKKEYGADGFVRIDGIDITFLEGVFIELKVAYGKYTDGKNESDFQKEITLIADGNLEFLAGQLFQHIIEDEE